ncbi:960_t:CDS:2 [Ambispora gerdemannii]|uniref:960_t:CDS:1 n=1 Tax=Ambispora gerdemannii TaxID=144530 RepID=A0A9N8W2P7_9GLOM|nr:960_t:CDS:2 [Ambispora gerdemannii]
MKTLDRPEDYQYQDYIEYPLNANLVEENFNEESDSKKASVEWFGYWCHRQQQRR